MAKITGKGIPTRKTAGAIGDIYTDVTSGKEYKCTFAYSPNGGNDYDYEWKPANNGVGTTDSISDKKHNDVIKVAVDISNAPDLTAVNGVPTVARENPVEDKKPETPKKTTKSNPKQASKKITEEKPQSRTKVDYKKAFEENKKNTER